MRKIVIIIALLASISIQPLFAKGYYFRNVSKEKPRYYDLDWQFMDLPVATLYYYKGEEELAGYVGDYIKEYQQEMMNKSSFTIEGAIPIFLYSIRTTFKQLQIISDTIPEGLLGFTMIEPNKRTAFVHDGSMRNTRHVIRHELFHSFMQGMHEKIRQKRRHLQVRFPVWFEEGLAESFAKKWDSWDDLAVRDLALQGRLNVEDFTYPKSHSFTRYLIDKYGEDKIFEFMKAEKGFYEKFKVVYGKTLKELQEDWQNKCKKKYYALINNDDADDIAVKVDEGFSPIIDSSSTIYYIDNYYGVNQIIKREFDHKDKKWAKKTTLFKDMRLDIEQIRLVEKKGDTLAFVAFNRGKDCIFISKGGNLRKIQIKSIISIYSMDLLDDRIVFSGQTVDGKRDIYTYDTFTGILGRLTDDFYCDITPSFKSDSEIYFASDRFGNYDIFSMNLETKEIKRITESQDEEMKPRIQGEYLYYISDKDSTFNLWKMNTITRELSSTRVTSGILDYSIDSSSNVAFVYFKNNSNFVYNTTLEKMNFKSQQAGIQVEKQITEKEPVPLLSDRYTFYPIGFFSGLLVYNEFEDAVSGSFLVNVSDLLGEADFFLVSAISQEQLFWFSFRNMHQPIGYSIDVFNLTYGVYTETGDYSFLSKGITLNLEKPLSDFHAVGCWATTQVAEKSSKQYGLFLPFFEGPGPTSGEGQLGSFGIFARKDTTTWNNYGPVTGVIADINVEASSEGDDFSYITWAKYIQHFPLGEACYVYRLIGSLSVGDRARVFRLGGFTLMSYDLFQAFETKSLLALSQEYRFLLLDALGFQVSGVFIGFRNIQSAFFMDLVKADNSFGALGVSMRLPFAALLLKFNYVKRTDFYDISDDLGNPGKWYFSLGYNY